MMDFAWRFVGATTDDPLSIREVLAAEASADAAERSFWVSVALLIGAIIAAGFAAIAAWAATREANSSRAQLAMAKLAEEQAEAVQVSAWLAKTGAVISVYVRNGNSGPVYDVLCRVLVKESAPRCPEPCVEIWRDSWIALSPAVAQVNDVLKVELSPQGRRKPSSDEKWVELNTPKALTLNYAEDWKLWDGAASSYGVAVEIMFRDSGGTQWRRGWNGKLERVITPPLIGEKTARMAEVLPS